MRKYDYVYALLDPRTRKVAYVGKSMNPQRRYEQHVKAKGKSAKDRWVRELRHLGLLPGMVILERIDGSASAAEIRWIAYYRLHGIRLLNRTRGGEGGLQTIRRPNAKVRTTKATSSRRNLDRILLRR